MYKALEISQENKYKHKSLLSQAEEKKNSLPDSRKSLCGKNTSHKNTASK